MPKLFSKKEKQLSRPTEPDFQSLDFIPSDNLEEWAVYVTHSGRWGSHSDVNITKKGDTYGIKYIYIENQRPNEPLVILKSFPSYLSNVLSLGCRIVRVNKKLIGEITSEENFVEFMTSESKKRKLKLTISKATMDPVYWYNNVCAFEPQSLPVLSNTPFQQAHTMEQPASWTYSDYENTRNSHIHSQNGRRPMPAEHTLMHDVSHNGVYTNGSTSGNFHGTLTNNYNECSIFNHPSLNANGHPSYRSSNPNPDVMYQPGGQLSHVPHAACQQYPGQSQTFGNHIMSHLQNEHYPVSQPGQQYSSGNYYGNSSILPQQQSYQSYPPTAAMGDAHHVDHQDIKQQNQPQSFEPSFLPLSLNDNHRTHGATSIQPNSSQVVHESTNTQLNSSCMTQESINSATSDQFRTIDETNDQPSGQFDHSTHAAQGTDPSEAARQVFRNPERVTWSDTKTVELIREESRNRRFGFGCKVKLFKNKDVYYLVSEVHGPPAEGKLKVGDWILSINGNPLQQQVSEGEKPTNAIPELTAGHETVKMIIQRPIGRKARRLIPPPVSDSLSEVGSEYGRPSREPADHDTLNSISTGNYSGSNSDGHAVTGHLTNGGPGQSQASAATTGKSSNTQEIGARVNNTDIISADDIDLLDRDDHSPRPIKGSPVSWDGNPHSLIGNGPYTMAGYTPGVKSRISFDGRTFNVTALIHKYLIQALQENITYLPQMNIICLSQYQNDSVCQKLDVMFPRPGFSSKRIYLNGALYPKEDMIGHQYTVKELTLCTHIASLMRNTSDILTHLDKLSEELCAMRVEDVEGIKLALVGEFLRNPPDRPARFTEVTMHNLLLSDLDDMSLCTCLAPNSVVVISRDLDTTAEYITDTSRVLNLVSVYGGKNTPVLITGNRPSGMNFDELVEFSNELDKRFNNGAPLDPDSSGYATPVCINKERDMPLFVSQESDDMSHLKTLLMSLVFRQSHIKTRQQFPLSSLVVKEAMSKIDTVTMSSTQFASMVEDLTEVRLTEQKRDDMLHGLHSINSIIYKNANQSRRDISDLFILHNKSKFLGLIKTKLTRAIVKPKSCVLTTEELKTLLGNHIDNLEIISYLEHLHLITKLEQSEISIKTDISTYTKQGSALYLIHTWLPRRHVLKQDGSADVLCVKYERPFSEVLCPRVMSRYLGDGGRVQCTFVSNVCVVVDSSQFYYVIEAIPEHGIITFHVSLRDRKPWEFASYIRDLPAPDLPSSYIIGPLCPLSDSCTRKPYQYHVVDIEDKPYCGQRMVDIARWVDAEKLTEDQKMSIIGQEGYKTKLSQLPTELYAPILDHLNVDDKYECNWKGLAGELGLPQTEVRRLQVHKDKAGYILKQWSKRCDTPPDLQGLVSLLEKIPCADVVKEIRLWMAANTRYNVIDDTDDMS